MHQTQPRHRGEPAHTKVMSELYDLGTDHSVTVRTSTLHHGGGNAHYVVTANERNENTGQVLLVLAPEAAGMLAEIIQRFVTTHPKAGVGFEAYDRDMWQHVAIDLVRNKVLASHDAEVVAAPLYGGPRPTTLEVVR